VVYVLGKDEAVGSIPTRSSIFMKSNKYQLAHSIQVKREIDLLLEEFMSEEKRQPVQPSEPSEEYPMNGPCC
jgi:hypothetical protein